MPKRRASSKGLRIELSDRGIWHVVGSHNGKRIRESLRTRVEATALELCALYEARLWKRHSYGEEAVRTFEEAALSYLKTGGKEGLGGEGRFLAPLIRHFKGRTIGTIKPEELRAAATSIYPDAGAAARNRQGIAPARAVILHAHGLGWCGAIRVKQFAVAKSRKHTAVRRDWLDTFMAEADRSKLPHLSALVLFMHQTGARVSEAIRLTGEWVDLGQRVAVLEKTKTDTHQARSLTLELVSRMAALGVEDGKRVFGYTDPKAVNRVMKRVAKRVGIAQLTTHSAGRHSFATNGLALTGDIKGTMDAGGWKSSRLFMDTYVHTSEARENMAAKLDEQTGPIDMNKPMSLKRRLRSSLKR